MIFHVDIARVDLQRAEGLAAVDVGRSVERRCHAAGAGLERSLPRRRVGVDDVHLRKDLAPTEG